MGKNISILLIRAYRGLSLFFRMVVPVPTGCRFVPSCSEYMEASIRDLGLVRGLQSGLRRLLACHPFHSAHYKDINHG